MQRFLFVTGTVLASLAVALGAAGAHMLKKILTEENLSRFETGIKYQFYGAVFILLTSLFWDKLRSPLRNWAALTGLAGMLVFSSSLYLLSLSDNRVFAKITPAGGILMIAAWLILAFSWNSEQNT